MNFTLVMQTVGNMIDVAGVLVILTGLLIATVYFICRLIRSDPIRAYMLYRQMLGRSILLGLEFLVAGDIIRTVAVSPTLMNVAVLLGIVVIRTFLSIVLQLEVEGRWPWQQAAEKV